MDFSSLGIASIAVITVICYAIGAIFKASNFADKWIPIICMVSGGILGIVAYVVKMPDFPSNDVISALAVGIVSGGAATGINQAIKQLGGDK
jgi:hypothetical protein